MSTKPVLLVIVLFSLFLSLFSAPDSIQAEDTFLVKINQKGVILKSKGVTFSISSKDYNQCIKTKDGAGVTPYYRYITEKKYIYINGSSLKQAELIKDEKQEKEVKLTFQEEENFELTLALSIQKDLPCLFVKSHLKNISSEPQTNIGYEWFTNYKFSEYIAQDYHRYNMPEDKEIETDFTQGMITKINWASIGLGRRDNWIYLMPDKNLRRGLGIIAKEETSFGIRSDRFIYWGEKRGGLEEGKEFSYEFILVPVESFEDFKDIIKITGRKL